jgi:periplasmic protein TonB
VNDPVDRVIAERKRLDAGFPGGVLLSFALHLLLVGAAIAAPILFPNKPVIQVADGFAVPLPRGGGGAPEAPAPAAAPPSKTEAPAAAPPPPLVLKPPKDEPKPLGKAVPELDSRKIRKKPEAPAPTRAPAGGRETKAPSAGTTAGTSPSSSTPGLAIGPPGPGVPDGTDSGGDWYLASVQQKIWMLWNQQLKSDFTQPVAVTFTILADGTVTDVETTQSSGASLLDMAAKRAIYSAGPFAPLPKSYGTNRKTIQATFKPTS